MTIHNKLVRDRIPEIIEQDNKTCSTKILKQADYTKALTDKLDEELREYKEAETNEEALEELADLLELIHALAKTHDSDIEAVETIRQEKVEKRGGFEERIFLIEVTD